MGRYKGVGMPRAKKQKLDAVRDRALEQVATADAESACPHLALHLIALCISYCTLHLILHRSASFCTARTNAQILKQN